MTSLSAIFRTTVAPTAVCPPTAYALDWATLLFFSVASRLKSPAVSGFVSSVVFPSPDVPLPVPSVVGGVLTPVVVILVPLPTYALTSLRVMPIDRDASTDTSFGSPASSSSSLESGSVPATEAVTRFNSEVEVMSTLLPLTVLPSPMPASVSRLMISSANAAPTPTVLPFLDLASSAVEGFGSCSNSAYTVTSASGM